MAHVGTMKCPVPKCAGTAAVSHSKTNTRNVQCPFCGFSGYGQEGSKAAKLIDAATTPSEDADAKPTPPAAGKGGGLLIGG